MDAYVGDDSGRSGQAAQFKASTGPLAGPASPVVARLSFEPGIALACVRMMLSVVSPLGAF